MSLSVSVRHQFPGFTVDAAFEAPTPGVTVLFGPSGCGKSTLLATVAGLLRPDFGRIAIDDATVLDTASGLSMPAERRRCGVVFQDALLFPHLSVEGNLRYGLRRAPKEATGSAFDEIVALLGIGPLLVRRPTGLSGGERQRVALGRALLSRPRLLLLDEPLAALDSGRKTEILPFLARVRDSLRVPMLYVTHALDEVDYLADTLVLMEQGQVRAAGTLEALSARADLPLAARDDAGSVFVCRVTGHDPARGLTHATFNGGALVVPLRALSLGATLRLRIVASDVSIAAVEPAGLSVQNILAATVAAMTPSADGHSVTVSLALGTSVLLARVTRDAVSRLGLAPGMAVWALIKSVALADRVAMG